MVVLGSEAFVIISTLFQPVFFMILYRFSAMAKELTSDPDGSHALELSLRRRCRFQFRSDISGGWRRLEFMEIGYSVCIIVNSWIGRYLKIARSFRCDCWYGCIRYRLGLAQLMGLSPGPIFVIRPLPWQVRLHGRSKKLIKKEGFGGSEEKTAWELLSLCPGSSPPVCALCPASLLSLFCFIFACLQITLGFWSSATALLSHHRRYYAPNSILYAYHCPVT